MKRTLIMAAVALGLSSLAVAQPRGGGQCCGAGPTALAGNPVVEVIGRISRVQITPGGGMPFIEVKRPEVVKVYLGSIRYLMAQGFNPKVDDEVVVKAYKTTTDMIAISVTLVAQNKTVKLRDEKGYPMWRGGGR